MNWPLPDKKEILLLALAGGLALAFGIAALETMWSAQERLQQSAALNAKLRQFVESGGKSAAMGSPSGGLSADDFMGDGTPAEISAQLSTLLSGIASAQGLQVLSTGGAPQDSGTANSDGNSSAVLEANGRFRQILGTLSAVAQARPRMAITRLEIRSTMPQGSNPQEEAPLSLSLRVKSFSRPNAAAAAASP